MKSSVMVVLAGLSLMLCTMPGMAVNLTLLPNNPVAVGSGTLGIDGDSPAAWGSGSWEANGSTKSQFYFTPQQLFGESNVTIGDLSSISYFTKTSSDLTGANPVGDWYVQIYTTPYTGGAASWYGDRITAEPYQSKGLSVTPNDWTMFQSNTGTNQLRFYNAVGGYFGSYTDGFLSDLSANYGSHTIKYITMGTGSDWAAGFTGQLDGLNIQLKNGNNANVNFEAVPEPGVLSLISSFGVCGAGLFFKKRKA